MKKFLDNLHSVIPNWLENSDSVIFRPLREFRDLGNNKTLKPVQGDSFKKFLAFSLVELMISLIVISVVTAAFAPVVTKKLKTSYISVSSSNTDYIFDEDICSNKITNCSICIGTICVKCMDGYYLEENICKACSAGCGKCKNGSICSECNDGYYITNNTCSKCDDNCISCSSEIGCISCADGYKVQNKGCSIVTCKGYEYRKGTECFPCHPSLKFTCRQDGYITGCSDTGSGFQFFSAGGGGWVCCTKESQVSNCSSTLYGYSGNCDYCVVAGKGRF